jgi:hypothetical protein
MGSSLWSRKSIAKHGCSLHGKKKNATLKQGMFQKRNVPFCHSNITDRVAGEKRSQVRKDPGLMMRAASQHRGRR